jgi:hypothetical protein
MIGSFSTSNLKGMVPVLKEKARELSEYMQGLIDGGNGVFEGM